MEQFVLSRFSISTLCMMYKELWVYIHNNREDEMTKKFDEALTWVEKIEEALISSLGPVIAQIIGLHIQKEVENETT